jgi:hypothetical protein
MIFGAKISFDKNPSFPGGFTLSVNQGNRNLHALCIEMPEAVLDEIYKRGALIVKPDYVDEAYNAALARWCIRETEARIRDGRLDETPKGILPIPVAMADVPTIVSLYHEKACDYQISRGKELFCSAADPRSDKTVVFNDGPLSMAPTTRPLCRECDLPNSDVVCSHLAHPGVYAIPPHQGALVTARRKLGSAYCGLGYDMHGVGEKCRAGANDCWVREIQIENSAPAVDYSPRELPTALDFLSTIWQQHFKEPLFKTAKFQRPAALSLPCGTQEDFLSRMGDLNELLRTMDIPDKFLPEENRAGSKDEILKTETLKRLSACLLRELEPDARDIVARAVDILKALNVVRNKLTHGGVELVDGLRLLGIEYPIVDHAAAWDKARARAAEALTTIRECLDTAA